MSRNKKKRKLQLAREGVNPFTELPKDLQNKYHYDPEASQKFAADTAAQINAHNAVVAAKTRTKKEEENVDRLLQQVRIFAIIKPFHYGEKPDHCFNSTV